MNSKRILLMRHAEKTGALDDIHLSAAGQARAAALADYVPAAFGTPGFLIATSPSKRSIRPIETIAPLAARLGKQVTAVHADDAYGELAAELLWNPAFAGALIVVCWHHGKIPKLARALGAVRGSYPDPWSEGVFNVILDLTYGESGPPLVAVVTQPF